MGTKSTTGEEILRSRKRNPFIFCGIGLEFHNRKKEVLRREPAWNQLSRLLAQTRSHKLASPDYAHNGFF